MEKKGDSPNVLLVEDSEDDRFFFKYAFKRAELGAHLFTAQDGIEAIEFLKKEAGTAARSRFPQFVFLDLKMPECDGFDVLRWMKEHSLLERTSVFVLSGSAEPQDVQLAKELGASEYLVKPIRHTILRQVLQAGGDESMKPG
jgi:CheY-like chemotaxis protein